MLLVQPDSLTRIDLNALPVPRATPLALPITEPKRGVKVTPVITAFARNPYHPFQYALCTEQDVLLMDSRSV